MIEQKIARLENELKSLKSSLPVAGSLMENYFYTKSASHSYAVSDEANFSVRFVPMNPDGGIGITDLYTYCNAYNPNAYLAFFSILRGYYIDNTGAVRYDGGFSAGIAASEYRLDITASVCSTVPGRIEITFS